jgi:hypothetical protein
MPQSKSKNPYPEVRTILDTALESPYGIQLSIDTWEKAFTLRMRCYTVRTADRKFQARMRTNTDPFFGRSIYDDLTITSIPSQDPKDGSVVLLSIEKRSMDNVTYIEIEKPITGA